MNHHLILYANCVSVFSLYKIIELYYPALPFLHTYLEDLLALPIVLKSAQLIIQTFMKGQRGYRIKAVDITLITLGFSAYFEGLLPFVDQRFTTDPLDVVMYFTGASIFYFFMNSSNAYPQDSTIR